MSGSGQTSEPIVNEVEALEVPTAEIEGYQLPMPEMGVFEPPAVEMLANQSPMTELEASTSRRNIEAYSKDSQLSYPENI